MFPVASSGCNHSLSFECRHVLLLSIILFYVIIFRFCLFLLVHTCGVTVSASGRETRWPGFESRSGPEERHQGKPKVTTAGQDRFLYLRALRERTSSAAMLRSALQNLFVMEIEYVVFCGANDIKIEQWINGDRSSLHINHTSVCTQTKEECSYGGHQQARIAVYGEYVHSGARFDSHGTTRMDLFPMRMTLYELQDHLQFSGRQHSLKWVKGKQCFVICSVVQQEERESIPASSHGCTLVQCFIHRFPLNYGNNLILTLVFYVPVFSKWRLAHYGSEPFK
ncbi:hypothetical protein ANN_19019 [Periplaneta americana]|uniref:Uncharacterized protein n=1 Tax=Periplaneta americana TaxID=6978 RepID=A0ABQ8SRW4_PERAM|nr:hypothetical protein ANN_19019 [Periplaneta americana]